LVTTVLAGVVPVPVPEPLAEVPVPLDELPELAPELEPEPDADEPLPELEPALEPELEEPLEAFDDEPVVVLWCPVPVLEPLAEVPVPLDELLVAEGVGVETAVLVEPELSTRFVDPPFREPRVALSAAAASMPYFAEAAMMPTETTLRIDFVVVLTRQTPLSESVPLGFQRASGSFRPSWSMLPGRR
jgi:hypothetical protein